MGKKKTKPIADHVRQKRKGPVKKNNPFEVKINKQKHDVLGRKISKFEKGMPGSSRSKATERRKKTLLKEYENQFKSNKFVDKRFGEHDTSLTLEDKMVKRFTMERSRTSSRSKFNLNEEGEELTHYGQSLAEIETFDEPYDSDDIEDNDEDKRDAAKLVADQHFGGFLKKRDPEEGNKSWKERMEEMIGESKKKKYERQMEKEQSVKMTEDLDQQWQSLHSLLHKTKRRKEEEDQMKADDYDIAVNSLKFEVKGQATDRLKSEEEIAREEKEKLEKLEADRMRRMKGLSENDVVEKPTHRSADDLDDGFSLEPKLDFDYVSYKDGKLLQGMSNTDRGKKPTDDKDDASEDAGEDASEDAGEDDSDDGSGAEEDGESSDDQGEADDQLEEEEEDSESEEEEDDYEDLASDDEDSQGEGQIECQGQSEVRKKVKVSKNKQTTQETQHMIDEAKKELPYTFNAPGSYDELLEILEGHDLENQLTIIERVRKCHHPSLAEGNKTKLETLFELLVQFYCDLCMQDEPQLEFVNRLIPHLYQLSHVSEENSVNVIVATLSERQQEFAHICSKKAGRGLYPGLDTLLLFKLISLLYPTSDFRHQVTTSAMLFMCQILGQSPVNNGRDIVAGLFLCSMCLEYVSLSKRYIPEVTNFLHGILFYASNKELNKFESVMPPFKPVGDSINLLQVSSKVKRSSQKGWSLTEMLPPVVDANLYKTDTFRIKAIETCLGLLSEFSTMYGDLCTYKDVFSPVAHMCKKLPTTNYPATLQTSIVDLLAEYEERSQRKLPPLAMQKKKPKPLKMFEPKVEEKFDGRKKGKRGTRDFNEKQKLLHKHKKETRGAMRELKKDTKFLAREKLSAQLAKDEARKRKVREIMGGLAHQEGEYKKLKLGIREEDPKT